MFNPVSKPAAVDAMLAVARYRIEGATKDSTGTPLAACTVKVIRADVDTRTAMETSDSNGIYSAMSNNGGDHYVVAYKAGSPDVAGTTVNTLRGS